MRHRERLRALRHYWLTIAFVGGFVLDNLTLGRVDQLFAMVLLFVYIVVAGVSLALLYAGAAGKLPDRIRPFVLTWAPMAVQFTFGGLLSGTLVFYSQSGSWSVAWPFLLLIAGIMVGNEAIRDRTKRLLFNLLIFFLGIFSYLVLFIPVILKKMGAVVFVGSGMVSLVVIFLYIRILRRIIPNFIELHTRLIIFSIGMTFCVLNFLYFGNIIPPIPLSLKHIDIYHNVEKAGPGTYRLTYEEGPWYKFWRQTDTTYRYTTGSKVFCYVSVFAPTDFSLDVFHKWEYYDDTKGEWVMQSRIPYAIAGGNERGYRGYTYIENVHDGEWRCNVETARGQVLGRETFFIESGTPDLVTVTD